VEQRSDRQRPLAAGALLAVVYDGFNLWVLPSRSRIGCRSTGGVTAAAAADAPPVGSPAISWGVSWSLDCASVTGPAAAVAAPLGAAGGDTHGDTAAEAAAITRCGLDDTVAVSDAEDPRRRGAGAPPHTARAAIRHIHGKLLVIAS
jgi:hypothetical protein